MDKSSAELRAFRIACGLAIEIFRINTSPRRGQSRFGAQSMDTLILAAVTVGVADGRPMTASKLADYVGIPRATVIRRLAALEAMGLVVRRGRATFHHTPAALSGPERKAALAATMRAIKDAAAALSKLDT